MQFQCTRLAVAYQYRLENTVAPQRSDIVREEKRRVRILDSAVECHQNSIHHAWQPRRIKRPTSGYASAQGCVRTSAPTLPEHAYPGHPHRTSLANVRAARASGTAYCGNRVRGC